MRRWALVLFFAVLLTAINTGCRTFEGFGNPRETYTSRYNLPSQRIIPYTNPAPLYGELEPLDLCDLVETEEGGVECL